jgi:hypothetical protein
MIVFCKRSEAGVCLYISEKLSAQIKKVMFGALGPMTIAKTVTRWITQPQPCRLRM